jgi:hypothetical protein
MLLRGDLIGHLRAHRRCVCCSDDACLRATALQQKERVADTEAFVSLITQAHVQVSARARAHSCVCDTVQSAQANLGAYLASMKKKS